MEGAVPWKKWRLVFLEGIGIFVAGRKASKVFAKPEAADGSTS
jgi:hypothetical protein